MSGDLSKLEGEGAGYDPVQCYVCPLTGSEGKRTPFHSRRLPFGEARETQPLFLARALTPPLANTSL